LLAAGGRLVYASCSALHAENAEVVGTFAQRTPDVREVTSQLVRELGLKQFATEESPEPGFRIAAGTADMDGFYYACLEKTKG
jgi:16S rRNA (cytosine967-C5)-methyltransferase